MNIMNMEANKDLRMTSEEFLKTIINPAREEAGEKPTRHNKLVERIEDELDDQNLTYTKRVRRGNNVKVFTLNYEQLLLVGMRESKAVRRVVLKRLQDAYATIDNMVTAIEAGDTKAALGLAEEFKRHCVAGKWLTQAEYADYKSRDVGRFTGFKKR